MSEFDPTTLHDDPPEFIDGAALDAWADRNAGGSMLPRPPGGCITFTYHRPGGTLTYYRWHDEDGDRFYREDALRRRAADFYPADRHA